MDNYWKRLAYQRRELADCESEPIQFCGAIQSCGWLLACDKKTDEIIAVSENVEELFGTSLSNILGQKVTEFLHYSEATKSELRTFTVKSLDKQLEGTWSTSGSVMFLDLEPPLAFANRSPMEFVDQLRRLVHQVDSEMEIEPMLELAVKQLRSLTGLDRVMIYRFEPNWDGHVIAEAKAEGLDPMRGLFYPASDIPAQARNLYFESKYRMIVDVESEPVSVITKQGLGRTELNIGPSVLRAVSPFHIEYLRNMAVRSSFSVPLKVNGKLWGLIACHHYKEVRHLPRDVRSSCELAAQIISGRVADQISDRRLRVRNQILSLSQGILKSVSEGRLAVEAFREHGANLLNITESAGIYVRLGNDEFLFGQTPSLEYAHQIKEKLKHIDSLGLWQSENVSKDLGLPMDEAAAGALAVPLSFGFEDLMVWFRPAFVREVKWGGDPHMGRGQQDALTPRASFKVWVEKVEGRSREWNESAQEAAQFMLFTFVKGIFQKAAELSKTNKELARVTQAKDEFIGMISHELRTPLGVMIGWIDILSEDIGDNPNMRQALEIIDRNAKLQINLINDLLDVSRIISGKMRISPQANINIATIAREVVKDLSPTALSKSIDVKLDVPLSVTATVDSDRMRQIIWNLVSNAVKFTPKGGTVTVKIERSGSSYQIVVSDNGIGIPREQLQRIFDRFAQAGEGHAKIGGLGLGLSIVKALVELHGGNVRAESAGRDRGATFIASLPIFNLKPYAGDSFEAGEPVVPERPEFQGVNILVAEDQREAALALEYILKKSGATVTVCYDGQAAMEKMMTESFDLLLSDIGMPVLDGFDLIKQIRHLETDRRSAPLPAVALTAYATAKDRTRCLEAGYDFHLAKPVDREELFAMIRILLAKKLRGDSK